MFKIYKRTIRIDSSENPRQRLEYQHEEGSDSKLSKILTFPALIAGAAVGTLVFSVFFAVLLLPLSIMSYKAWRLMKTTQQEHLRQGTGDSINAEYTVISDAKSDKK